MVRPTFRLMQSLKSFRPLGDRVLIQRAESQTKTKGGILLPEQAQEKMNQGTVIAVGPGARNIQGELVPMQVKEGDLVLLPEFGGTKIKVDEKEFQLYRDSDILGTLQ
eukprot:Clim_evm9s34 gene=Clim_evmTU9s34